MESSDIDNDMVEPSGSALFRRCDPDPQGSVSKAWSLTILLILLFFGFAIFECKLIRSTDILIDLVLKMEFCILV